MQVYMCTLGQHWPLELAIVFYMYYTHNTLAYFMALLIDEV